MCGREPPHTFASPACNDLTNYDSKTSAGQSGWHRDCNPKAPVLYNIRYRVLEGATTIRNVGACLAFVAGSYLASGLINASPVTQPDLSGPRGRAVIVAPVEHPKPEAEPTRPKGRLLHSPEATRTL
jgi:hypothetical protein